ncbi:hypothetical protein ElyMa_000563300 [Elysia marginata]|uniref:Sema domain-containing protein n=1 Tax=Elysia marginata TaxID=1093978 RepID=A0AAV4G2G4_9GAST|nr:hypothetical protein ElyMa_000563300 [Elysia marginata]
MTVVTITKEVLKMSFYCGRAVKGSPLSLDAGPPLGSLCTDRGPVLFVASPAFLNENDKVIRHGAPSSPPVVTRDRAGANSSF